MSIPSRFNIRVYGILILESKILLVHEQGFGESFTKLPGGGVELGEGILDALKREWLEETDLSILPLEHYYTTDFFQKSRFDDSQIVSIYYRVRLSTDRIPENLKQHSNMQFEWFDLAKVCPDTFDLPIDKHIGGMLEKEFNR